MPRTEPWKVSDELWAKIEGLVPKPARREEGRTYRRKPGGGRKPMEARRAFEAIVYVLRTGIQWNALPKALGSSSTVHRHFQAWGQAGFFQAIWAAGLAQYDEMQGIAWEWQSIDGATHKAPLATECVGSNPTDRGKKRAQAQSVDRRTWHPAVARRRRSQSA